MINITLLFCLWSADLLQLLENRVNRQAVLRQTNNQLVTIGFLVEGIKDDNGFFLVELIFRDKFHWLAMITDVYEPTVSKSKASRHRPRAYEYLLGFNWCANLWYMFRYGYRNKCFQQSVVVDFLKNKLIKKKAELKIVPGYPWLFRASRFPVYIEIHDCWRVILDWLVSREATFKLNKPNKISD